MISAARLRGWTGPVALAGLVAASGGVNAGWIARNRRGLPFDIDEAGYLQRAVRDGGALTRHGLTGLWRAYRLPDPQAPALPMTAGVLRAVTGWGPTGLLAAQQLFLAVLLVSTYAAARKMVPRGWSLLAAFLVACVPAVINGGRDFHFALPAAALLTAALAAQLHAGDFDDLRWALGWGALLGLAALTRTMVLGLLPLLVLAAVGRVAAAPTVRRAIHLGAGVGLAAAISASWYYGTWPEVYRYLSGYGYGSAAAGYGRAHSVLSPAWWTQR
ncbi:MAG TPA: glycosyltransferase family 39 protein, partial [Acidimicrobiales bacterium]|nr:glycosyltransferase family 39 protein [Acidimicrobiales bacterium]